MFDYMELKTRLPKETIVKQLIDLKPCAILRFDLENCTSFTAKMENEEITVFCSRTNGDDFVSINSNDLSDKTWKMIYKDNLIYQD